MTDATNDQTITHARAAERDEVLDKARRAKDVTMELARYTSERKNRLLLAAAEALVEKTPEILEANEADSPGADYFVKKRIDQLMRKDSDIDTIILGCTHYPLLMNSIVKNVPDGVRVMPQGTYVAESLSDYLTRHADMERMITRGGTCRYLTTESEDRFAESAQIFLHEKIHVTHVEL